MTAGKTVIGRERNEAWLAESLWVASYWFESNSDRKTIMTKDMKLYTEEQVSVAINAAKANPEQAYLILAMLTPIELPSDEEIFSESLNHKEPDDFNCGSQFVIDYINQQNNETNQN